jgi:hypothetical protein
LYSHNYSIGKNKGKFHVIEDEEEEEEEEEGKKE